MKTKRLFIKQSTLTGRLGVRVSFQFNLVFDTLVPLGICEWKKMQLGKVEPANLQGPEPVKLKVPKK